MGRITTAARAAHRRAVAGRLWGPSPPPRAGAIPGLWAVEGPFYGPLAPARRVRPAPGPEIPRATPIYRSHELASPNLIRAGSPADRSSVTREALRQIARLFCFKPGNSCAPGSTRASSCPWARCSASSTGARGDTRGRPPQSRASSAASRPGRASAGGSRHTSCATRTRSSSPARACRSTSFSANSGTPTSAPPASTSKASTRGDHRHRPHAPAADDVGQRRAQALTTATQEEWEAPAGTPAPPWQANVQTDTGESAGVILSSDALRRGRRLPLA
jgi:hypothetical protein